MIRSTTGGVLRTYRSNLMHSFIAQNKARETMLTQRNFNSYAEDPAAASRAFQMRRSLSRVEAQYTINEAVNRKYDTAYSAIDGVQSLLKSRSTGDNAEAWSTVLEGLNDPTGDARTALGKVLSQIADTVVQTMNSKYGDTFIFAGADGLNVPFTWEGGKLYYRGVAVDTEVPALVQDGTNPIEIDPATGAINPGSGTYLKAQNTSAISAADYQAAVAAKTKAEGLDQAAERVSKALADNPTTTADPIQELIAAGKIQQTDVDDLKAAGLLTQDGEEVIVKPPAIPKVPKLLMDGANPATFDADGKLDPNGTHFLVIGDDDTAAAIDAEDTITKTDYEKAEADMKKLQYMMNDEATYVDIGLGMKENPDTDQLIASSAYDSSLQGITFLGYGVDEDGDPKNIVSLIKRMGEICSTYKDEPWGKENAHWEEFNRLAGKLEDSMGDLDSAYTDLSAATQKLKNNGELLEDTAYNLTEQISGVEDVDMAEAITSFIWAQYCYNAALKVGNSILSQSLMDYLN